MINNAGIETRTSILDTSPEDFDKVMNVNLRGVFFATQYAAKQMISQGSGGRIINISSVHEDWPMPNNTPYCVAKGGVRMLTRTAGVELAGKGVTIVNVGPGAVATPINDSTDERSRALSQIKCSHPDWTDGTACRNRLSCCIFVRKWSQLHDSYKRVRRWRHHDE
jgi:glucose 1-dehydrogenase